MTPEEVVLVDRHDNSLGVSSKALVHQPPGLLHRALSVVLWTSDNKVVIQRRSLAKYHFGGLWSNSCCSHPRPNESVVDAAARRVVDELGLAPSGLEVVGRFIYSARDDNTGLVESEVDHVLVGCIEGHLDPDPHEIDDLVLVDLERLASWSAAEKHTFSPWFFDVMCRAVPTSAGSAWHERHLPL